jgi:hypothetical protein
VHALRFLAVLVAVGLAGCSTLRQQPTVRMPGEERRPTVEVFVVKRRWHTDIGFSAADLPPQFASERARFPGAVYFLFGFGDRHYLLNRGRSFRNLLGAIGPGPGVILTTALVSTPAAAFGADDVSTLALTADEVERLEKFVMESMSTTQDGAVGLGPGPYDGSYYYASSLGYSGIHTCNTWTAEALEFAGLPIHSRSVELAGQVWRQVLPLRTRHDVR